MSQDNNLGTKQKLLEKSYAYWVVLHRIWLIINTAKWY